MRSKLIIPNHFTAQKVIFGIRNWLLLGAFLFLMSACASVPEEAVGLSELVGKDMLAIKESYTKLVDERFDDFRNQRISYLENEWTPKFISSWISDGRLVDVATGQVVFDESTNAFVAPSPGKAQEQLLNTVNMWSSAAIGSINDKRKELLGPLEEQEKQVKADIETAFGKLLAANTIVTSHLQSIRDVQEFQSEVRKSLDIDDVVKNLTDKLVSVSSDLNDGLDKIRKADGVVDGISNKIGVSK